MNYLESVQNNDEVFFFWAQKKHQQHPLLARLARQSSRIADGPSYAIIGLLCYYLDPNSGETFFFTTLFAFLLIERPCYFLLKNTIKRNRPCHKFDDVHPSIEPSDRFSLPSGHTSAAFMMASLCLVFYPSLAIIAFMFATTVALARVLLGVHYLTDTMAGALLGCSCALVALYSF